MFKASEIPARVQVFGFFLGGAVLSLITLGCYAGEGGRAHFGILGSDGDGICFDLHALHDPYGVPDNPARHGPTPRTHWRVVMSEVVVGAISAALRAGEAFGAREALGTLLIIAAALFEVLGRKQ